MSNRYLQVSAAAMLLLAVKSATATTFEVRGTDAAVWAKILGAVGITPGAKNAADLIVIGPGEMAPVVDLAQKHIVILEGTGPAVIAAGFKTSEQTVAVRQICDTHGPKMQIIWEEPATIQIVTPPEGFQVFATEKWKHAPVLAGKRFANGAILWMATSPGQSGIERYPYLLHALADLGLPLAAEATDLWAFFDSSYRIHADADYLARRWRKAGIGVLHVAAWHNMEPDPVQDQYLKNLIAACHRNAILVYAWLELPHVSEKFWADHPEWREKTAVGQDAQLDWRKLMNLQNPACHREVEKQIGALIQHFDWDGVNVAELYFESLEGASNPARFTPMDDDVRAEFKRAAGFDPKLLFDAGSPYSKDSGALRQFLDFRANLASRMQADWLDAMERLRKSKPYLDIVLTHIDDRFEPGIRDALGADVARSLPLIEARHSTLLVEDPATLWNLGPSRYSKLAEQYRQLTKGRQQVAVDINIVERYQDVYPTKKQTGVELFELVHEAAASFGRVALYFENSLEKQDLTLLPAAGTTARIAQRAPDEIEIDASEPTRVAWRGGAELDGKPWPVENSEFVLTPAGKHVLRVGTGEPAIKILDLNGELQSATCNGSRVTVSYASRSRAVALLGSPVSSIEVDGGASPVAEDQDSVLLPAGQHIVTFSR